MTSGASIDRPILLRKHQNSKAGAFFTDAASPHLGRVSGTKRHTCGKFCDCEGRPIFFCRVPR
ncbi:hypothetical protein FHX16_001005 [Rhizobium sp. BK661]|nr:hypothetical protein [Rhizobium sp. BK661]